MDCYKLVETVNGINYCFDFYHIFLMNYPPLSGLMDREFAPSAEGHRINHWLMGSCQRLKI